MKNYYIYTLSSSDTPNKIRYIGVTQKTLKERLYQHKYCAKHKRSQPVHKWIYSKYKKGFIINIVQIECCSIENWEEREQFWIKYYKDLYKEQILNVHKGGKHIYTKEMRNITGIERSIAAHRKCVCALYEDGTLFKTFESITSAAKFFNLKAKTAIGNALAKRSKQCCGYYWVTKEEYNKKNFKLEIRHTKNRGYKVYKYTLNNQLLCIYESIRECLRKEPVANTGLNTAIKNETPYKGHIWKVQKH